MHFCAWQQSAERLFQRLSCVKKQLMMQITKVGLAELILPNSAVLVGPVFLLYDQDD